MCFLSIMNYSNILRIKMKSVYVKDFLISTKVRLKRGEHVHGEEPISSEPTFYKVFITMVFGLCTCKWRIFVLVGDPVQFN